MIGAIAESDMAEHELNVIEARPPVNIKTASNTTINIAYDIPAHQYILYI